MRVIDQMDSNPFLRNLIIAILITLITTVALSYSPRVFKYDPITGLWKKVDPVESQIILPEAGQLNFSSTSVSVPLDGSIVIDPITIDPFLAESSTSKGNRQWFYYIEYEVGRFSEKKFFGLIAGQNMNIGTTTVWIESGELHVKFELLDGWLASESHLNITETEPSGNQSPGQYPYKVNHDPYVSEFEYVVNIRNKCQDFKKIYILLHLSVNRNSQFETAWAGGNPPSRMSVRVSSSKIAWYIKKPGKYMTNAFEVTINSTDSVTISFKNFDNVKPQGGIGVKDISVFYAISDDLAGEFNWIPAENLNNWIVTVKAGVSNLNFYQLVDLKTQSAGIYRNTGTITFTVQNTKAYIEQF